MASVRKPYVAAVLGALGAAATVATVFYTVYANKRNRAKMAEDEPTTDADYSMAKTSAPFSKNDEVSTPTTMNQFDVPPLSIPAAAPETKALVICAKGEVEISLASKFAEQSKDAGVSVIVSPPDVEHICDHAKTAAGTYDLVVVESAGAEGSSGVVLGEVLKLLKAGGKVAMMVSGDSDLGTARLITKRGLTFAGFLNVAPSLEDWRVFSGVRPAWEVGAAAPVRLPVRKPITEMITIAPAIDDSKNEAKEVKKETSDATRGGKTTWKISLDDDVGAEGTDSDLVDEDALLAESGPVKRATEKDSGDCSKRRRACKDCSCGRAELELDEAQSAAPVTVDDVDGITSACGNCPKGDAFRCATCPFLGKPVFEKGQERQILLADLNSQQDT